GDDAADHAHGGRRGAAGVQPVIEAPVASSTATGALRGAAAERLGAGVLAAFGQQGPVVGCFLRPLALVGDDHAASARGEPLPLPGRRRRRLLGVAHLPPGLAGLIAPRPAGALWLP